MASAVAFGPAPAATALMNLIRIVSPARARPYCQESSRAAD
jgi:hypothetical protein